MNKSPAYEQGYEAFFLRGETSLNNPFLEDKMPSQFDDWNEGNARAKADID